MFDQYPCDYQQEYMLVKGPDFVSLDTESILLTTPTKTGEYEIEVCSQISNSLMTKECLSFQITVVEKPKDKKILVINEPEFIANLSD